jgi:hypothetical protein
MASAIGSANAAVDVPGIVIAARIEKREVSFIFDGAVLCYIYYCMDWGARCEVLNVGLLLEIEKTGYTVQRPWNNLSEIREFEDSSIPESRSS